MENAVQCHPQGADILDAVKNCLQIFPEERITPVELLDHPLLGQQSQDYPVKGNSCSTEFVTVFDDYSECPLLVQDAALHKYSILKRLEVLIKDLPNSKDILSSVKEGFQLIPEERVTPGRILDRPMFNENPNPFNSLEKSEEEPYVDEKQECYECHKANFPKSKCFMCSVLN